MSKLLVSHRGKTKNASSGLIAFSQGFGGKTFHCAWQVFSPPPFSPRFRRLRQRALPLVTHRLWEATRMERVMDIVALPNLFGISISHITPASTTRPIRIQPLRNRGLGLNSKRKGTC